MQQTKTYKLNLIETDDAFSPEALNENARTLETQLSAVRGEFAAADAAEKTRVNAALAAEKTARETADAAKADQTALSALAGRVGALEAGKLLWKFGSYTGNGGVGKDHPTRIEFPFKPLLLIVKDPINWNYGGFPWLYGQTSGVVLVGPTANTYIEMSWENRAVQFYTTMSGVNATYQLNSSGREYKYFVLGIEE